MHFMYVDESGDPGIVDPAVPAGQGPSHHYNLAGVILPSEGWRANLTTLVDIRRTLRQAYRLPTRIEMHGAELINPRNNPSYSALGGRHTRVGIYRDFLRQVATRLPELRIINVYADKTKPLPAAGADWETLCWSRLIQRFHTYLSKSGKGAQGMIFADQSNEPKVRKLLRRMRVFNMVPSYFGGYYADPCVTIVEDVVMRSSEHSFFVQIADMVAHALYRKENVRGGLRKFNVDRLFSLVEPLLVKEAGRGDPMGVVRL